MDKLFLVQFAIRNMISHRMRTILTLVGIMIGISAIVFLVSFAFGIEKLVTSEVTGGDAFKLVDVGTGDSQIIKLNDDSINNIRKLPYTKSLETTVSLAAKAVENDKSMDVALFSTSQKYLEWSGIKPQNGKYFEDNDPLQIVVDTAFLNFFNLQPAQALGKKIKLDIVVPKEMTQDGEAKTISGREYTITGVIQNDTSPNAYISAASSKELGIANYSQAKVEISSSDKVLELRKQIEGMGFQTQYVGDTVSQIEQIFSIFKIILGSFGLIALIVASLGMFNTLTISLLERMKEVALLKILGTKRKDVSNLFLTEALLFGILGGVLGIALGYAAGQLANYILDIYAKNNGGDPVVVFYYPLWFILSILAFSLLIGLMTGVYPARRAATVSSLDVIRYE